MSSSMMRPRASAAMRWVANGSGEGTGAVAVVGANVEAGAAVEGGAAEAGAERTMEWASRVKVAVSAEQRRRAIGRVAEVRMLGFLSFALLAAPAALDAV